MKTVKITESFHVAATGVTYTKGQTVEVSDDLAKRKSGKYLEILDTSPASDSKVKKDGK